MSEAARNLSRAPENKSSRAPTDQSETQPPVLSAETLGPDVTILSQRRERIKKGMNLN